MAIVGYLLGDMATVEADGSITVFGRGTVCINSGGEKLFPEEIENAVKSHPDVYDVVIVGVPDERWGEKVAALVQARPGSTLTLDSIQEHCRKLIAGYKVPRALRVVEKIETPSERQTGLPVGEEDRRRRGYGGRMKTQLTEMFGIEYPIFAFTHSPKVAAAVSRAGGLGVFGALSYTPEQLREHLEWINDNVDGKPYGVDVVMPASYEGADLSDPEALIDQLETMIPGGLQGVRRGALEQQQHPGVAGRTRPTRVSCSDGRRRRPGPRSRSRSTFRSPFWRTHSALHPRTSSIKLTPRA